jgi:hypothetical protein
VSFADAQFHLLALNSGAASGLAPIFEARVLFAWRRQPLLVPAHNARCAHAAVRFFVGNPLLRGLGHVLLTLDRKMPSAGILPLFRWEDFPAPALFGEDLAAGASYAVLCGSPGPLQKATIICQPRDGLAPRVAKVALKPTADVAVALEERWLHELGHLPQVAAFLPRLTHAGALPGGRRFVAMSALPAAGAASRFGHAHRQFLFALGAQGEVHPWADTEAFNRLRERARAVRPMMKAEHRELIDAALHEVEQRIGVCRLPACLAHGDFAPWNVRIQAGRLFAFDWEYAQAGANPLHDFLHFHLMSRLARHRPLGTRFMAPLLSRAGRHADSVFGVRSGVAEAAGALAMHYLLDVITFYVEASRCLDPRHPVLRAYLRLLEQRGQWLSGGASLEGRT